MSRKLALIIGNNDYSNKPLTNCVNDATCLANVLRCVENFQVELKTNLKSEEMYECIKGFTESIKRNDFIIFFFAGHGIQWGDQNFLLPCDNNKIKSGNDMQRYAINAQIIVNGMAEMNPYIVLFLLDCCRTYWMPVNTSNNRALDQQIGGLNQMKVPRQTLIAFACAAGEVVSDQFEASNNGLFTKYLLKHITTPDEHIETILRRVANDVATESGYSQVPFRVSSIISDEVYLTSSVPSKQQICAEKRTLISTKAEKLPLQIDSIGSSKQEINILLLGETGVGRSTFINALANYLVNDTLDQAANDKMQVLIPFGFTFTDKDTFDQKTIGIGKQDEYENWNDRGESSTQKCRSFVFSIGDRLLRLIETPAVGDTRGFEQDVKHMNETITYIARYEYLNGICILLKPNEKRLSVVFRYYVTEILRHLPKTAIKNIMFVFTNARSTFFRCGKTCALLRVLFDQYQQEHGAQVHFPVENTFFLDNEALRYLALRRSGIQLDDQENQFYVESWDHTVKEYARLIAYVTTRPPHIVIDTVSLYEVQQLSRILTHPIFQTFRYIEQAIQLAREYQERIISNSRSFSQRIPQNDVQILFLDHPRLVCTNSKCTGFTDVNGLKMIEYKSICYDRCYFTGNAIGDKNHSNIRTCEIMDQETGICSKCHCFWNEHMFILYEYQRTSTGFDSSDKQYTEPSKISRLDQIDKYISDARSEITKIDDVYKKLCEFLRVNAIVPYNKDILGYIAQYIREEQMKQNEGTQNDDAIKYLQMLHSNYENEINPLKKTLENERNSVNKTGLIEDKDIFALVGTLYDLPINGQKIRKQVEEIKSNQNKIENRENFVKLPAKANSSKLMLQLKDFMSKS